MRQTNQSTAPQHVNPLDEPSSFDTAAATEDLFRNEDEDVRLVWLHEKRTALTVCTDDQDAEATPQPASAFRGQNDDNLSQVLTFREQNAENLSQILTFPQRRARQAPADTLHALQEWEGYVLEIRPQDVVARLIDLTAGALQEEEEAVIPLAEISDDDVAKMREGSIFRWVIGYKRTEVGTKERVSRIVFRDLPAMTKSDLQDGQAWADQISESFDQ